MWNIGNMCRQRSAGPSSSERAMFRAEAARLRWLSGTVRGKALVPEVWSTSAISSGPPGPPRSVAASGASVVSSNAPASAPGAGEISRIGTPIFSATARAGVPCPTSASSSFGCNLESRNSLSACLNSGLRGAAAAPAITPRLAIAASGPLGSTIATRSPRPTPMALRRSTMSMIRRWRRAYEASARPGASRAGASGVLRAFSEIRSKMVSGIVRSCSKRQEPPGATQRKMTSADRGGPDTNRSNVACLVGKSFTPHFPNELMI